MQFVYGSTCSTKMDHRRHETGGDRSENSVIEKAMDIDQLRVS